jgi:hypothetical protein
MMRKHFKLNNRALVALVVSSAFSTSAYSAIGKVEFVVGGANAKAANGKQRPLSKGTDLETGDLIETGDNARVQIRFNDGAFVSLQPQTQFRIDDYRYNQKSDGEEKGFFSLFKGGLRTITGIIGRANKKNYQLSTPTATIGIRGTAYTVTQNGDALNVSVGKGQIFVSNDAGGLLLSSGQSAFISGPRNSPLIINDKPVLPPSQDTQKQNVPEEATDYAVGDVRNSTGSPLVVSGTGLVSGPGYALAKSNGTTTVCDTACGAASVTAMFDEKGQLTQYSSGAAAFTIGSAVYEGFVVGPIGWGRWVNGTADNGGTPIPLGPGQGEHVVIGIPTASMPVSGVADYNVLGFTTPTFSDGVNLGLGMGTVSGKMTANFGASNVAINLDFAFTGGAGTSKYNFNIPTATIAGSGFTGAGTPTFVSGAINVCGGSGCGGNVVGFFAGDNASHAGLVYQMNSGAFVQTNGAVTFVKQ